jgi:hypothetical protein
MTSKKLKHEADLIREAIRVGTKYAEKRGAAKFEATDSQDDKVEFIYKLLVHDKLIQPLAKDDITLPNMKHKLAIWISKQLPEDHPLLQ